MSLFFSIYHYIAIKELMNERMKKNPTYVFQAAEVKVKVK